MCVPSPIYAQIADDNKINDFVPDYIASSLTLSSPPPGVIFYYWPFQDWAAQVQTLFDVLTCEHAFPICHRFDLDVCLVCVITCYNNVSKSTVLTN